MLEGGESLFRDEVALDYDFLPKTIPYREQEQQYIATCMKPLFSGRSGRNLFIHGPPGIGKTAAVRHVLRELEEKTEEIVPILINCWQYNTRSSLLTESLIQLGYPAPRKGKPVDELLSKIREWLDKNRGIAVALDEFDQLEDQTEVVYDLQMLNEEAENPLGILMVSNPLTMQDGFTINETNDTITEVTPNYSETSGLYNTALNLTLIIVGMMFTWNGYIRLYEERVNKREEKYERIENE